MAGLIPQDRLSDVEMHLQNNLLYMKVDSINQHLIKMILGPSFQHCRSIYLLSRSEAQIDMVPKSDDLTEEVLSLSGTQEYRNRTFQVTICLAHDTVVRNKQTQTPKHMQTPTQLGFIPTVDTPTSPWILPTTPDHTGHTPPPVPTPLKQDLRDPPKHPPTPRDPFILDLIQKVKPIQDPSFKFTQTEPEPSSKLKGKPLPPKRRSSELLTIRNPEYTPSKKYFPLSIPQFGDEDPGKFTFAQTGRNPHPPLPEPKKPDTLDLLTQAMSQLDTEELRSFIGALMLIDKQREGRSDHNSLSPELDQAQDPQMGGKVGVAGGRGLPQHDPDYRRFDLDHPNNPTSTPNNPIGNAPTTLNLR